MGATKDYDAIWQYPKEGIFTGVMEHEVGHTIGLRHNFAGSYDSLNYHNHYWDHRSENIVLRDPITDGDMEMQDLFNQGVLTATQSQNRIEEYETSSIMDYGNKFNSDFNGLGKYDHAAITFGYTKHVEVFEDLNDTQSAGLIMKWRFNDCSSRIESVPNPNLHPVVGDVALHVCLEHVSTRGGRRRRETSHQCEVGVPADRSVGQRPESQADSASACRQFRQQNPGSDALDFFVNTVAGSELCGGRTGGRGSVPVLLRRLRRGSR